MKRTLLFIFNMLLFSSIYCQKASDIIQGDLIIQLNENVNIEELEEKYQFFKGTHTSFESVELLSKSMNIWLFNFNSNAVNHDAFVNKVVLDKNILEWQNNSYVENRANTPNDTEFGQQWQYINPGGGGGIVGADIDADLAWDITTGGVTPNGDTIVVCVVDDGVLNVHEDLEENLWVNKQEIPNNGIDDDANGYIDDYLGYNANDDDDDIYDNFNVHGNAVAGVIGAKGNNNLGVAGINWDVKLMIVKNQGASQAQVIKAYSYPLELRKLYNITNGVKGAFVVAVNSSWGINFGQPSANPLWCAFYDEMGEAGILNCGATINSDVNVDVDGDMPTGCSSDYLITVTNMWKDDEKVTGAGYGLTTIDLGAFGADAHTLSQNNTNGYTGFGGTSGATPQVAGAVALLYSAPCPTFGDFYINNPGEAALKIKEFILEGVDDNTSLQGITTTGGRLNLFGSLNKLDAYCIDCAVVEFNLLTDVTETTATIQTVVTGNDTAVTSYGIRYREVGSSTWIEENFATVVSHLSDLEPNTQYEYQVFLICGSDQTPFSSPKTFNTNASSINRLSIDYGIEVYPNPTRDIIYINLMELQEGFKVKFFDILGKLIYQDEMKTRKKKIDISVLQNGIYILQLQDKLGTIYTLKVNKI